MKLFNLANKDVFLMSLAFDLSPFGRHLGPASKGEQSQTFAFLQTGPRQPGFLFEELPPLWVRDVGNDDSLRRDHGQKAWFCACGLHSNPNIYVKDTHICYQRTCFA